jgi:hypothetical protein
MELGDVALEAGGEELACLEGCAREELMGADGEGWDVGFVFAGVGLVRRWFLGWAV